MGANGNVMTQEGTIVIVDISGFTKLVFNTDIVLGRQIIFSLLQAIIDKNELGLKVSEIEGDAVLFYRFGPPPSQRELIRQFAAMMENFQSSFSRFSARVRAENILSIKMVVHYGRLSLYTISNFTKLYGDAVLEAHLLLKNNVASDTYILMTSAYMEKVPMEMPVAGADAVKQCEILRGIRKMCYSYYDFQPGRAPLAFGATFPSLN